MSVVIYIKKQTKHYNVKKNTQRNSGVGDKSTPGLLRGVRGIAAAAYSGRTNSSVRMPMPLHRLLNAPHDSSYNYNYIEKKLHTVYPMLYKPTLKNSKN